MLGYGQYSIWTAFSGVDCNNGLTAAGCENWIHFTIPALHLSAYSFGSVLCARLGHRGTPWLVNALLGRFRPLNHDSTKGMRKEEEDKGTEHKQADRGHGEDPTQALWIQSGVFHTAWFKNGESLSTLQRAGYTVLSLLFFGIALYLSRDAVMFAREGDFMGVIFTLIFGGSSLGFLVPSLLGLKNVLRFRRGEPRK
jgi:hypothetical protein